MDDEWEGWIEWDHGIIWPTVLLLRTPERSTRPSGRHDVESRQGMGAMRTRGRH